MSELPSTLPTVAYCAHSHAKPPTAPAVGGFAVHQGAPVPLLMTVAEVDVLLANAHEVPTDERGDVWQSYVDALLDRRVALASVEENLRTIRVMRAAETR
jgi:hypothetical protein